MGKKLIITEKPSVAREFAKALKEPMKNQNGFMESQHYIITWCVGHLVTMSYPEVYDPALKKWSLATLPFIPTEYKYEVIENVKKQFNIIKTLFHRSDLEIIYNAGDSGREGEYIQRLVLQMAGYNQAVTLKRIWIDSQTEEEILRGIKEAKDMSAYDNLSNAAYLRAKEDYLMGINFSRVLTLKYATSIKNFLSLDKTVISVGRVMTCVLGIVIDREREIRAFTKTPFFKINATFSSEQFSYEGEWRCCEKSRFYQSPLIYNSNGFLKRETAENLIEILKAESDAVICSVDRKKAKKNPPLLFNLAELQNECAKRFKISPDQTLNIAQELYEKKLTTYPRTDARVLSTAVTKEIKKNLNGLWSIPVYQPYLKEIAKLDNLSKLAKSRYVNDKQITDHYAIIPTGQGLGSLSGLSELSKKVFDMIVRRFLSIFYPPAVYQKIQIVTEVSSEEFLSNYKSLLEEGYLTLYSDTAVSEQKSPPSADSNEANQKQESDFEQEEQNADSQLEEFLMSLKKGMHVSISALNLKEGETSPPKRFNSGSIILAMENAGQLIEDEELRSQIKGSGIGTSATRAEILKKLFNIKYLSLNKKNQIITPTLFGELIYEVVSCSIRPLLNPTLTASWEKGLSQVADGTISPDDYMLKLDDFVKRRTNYVKEQSGQDSALIHQYQEVKKYYA